MWVQFAVVAPNEGSYDAECAVPPGVPSTKHVSAFTLFWVESLETINERVVGRLGVGVQPLRVFKATKHQLSWSLSQHNDFSKTTCTSFLVGLVRFFALMYVLNIQFCGPHEYYGTV